ncbi:hypothetical protein P7C73_g4345, partial [Tremellales sp. Uapishka_1]
MGQSASSSLPSSLPELALHCLRVADNSPAADVIEPFFDYLVGVDEATEQQSETRLSGLSPTDLGRILEENEGSRIGLKVYNAKTQRIRGEGLLDTFEAVVGGRLAGERGGCSFNVKWIEPQAISPWSFAEVMQSSTSARVGLAYPRGPRGVSRRSLVPFGDWICGWAGGPLHSESDFYDLVDAHTDRPLRLYVYSADLDNLREVVIIPNRQWGGEGLLGCGVGFGLLHRIPRPATPLAPPQGDDSYFATLPRAGHEARSPDVFVPAHIAPNSST